MSRAKGGGRAEALRRFKPYPAYKDSGVEWLGEVPAHWAVVRSKRLFRLRNVKALAEDRQLTASQQHGVIPQTEFMAREGRRVVQVVTGADILKHVEANDFVISMRSFQGGIEWSHSSGAISSAYVVLAPASVVWHPYFAHLLKSKSYIQALQSTSDLVRDGQALRFENFTQVALPSVPPAEQRAIADFLDRETARIDALVAKKERLIELLREERTALITRAVTKGLDPDVPMKDSGVEWLREIPAHWEVKRVKRLCLVRRGASPRPIDDPMYFDDEGEYAWVRIADVTASERYLETTKQRLSALGKTRSVALEPGELFVSIAATVGKPIITKIKCCIHDGFVYFVGLHEDREYLYYLFACGEPYKGLGKLGTQVNLNTDTIGDIHLPLPSRKEQRAIVQFLDGQAARIDCLITRVRDAIEHLKELRTALISAAVAGKIDVREEVA